MPKNPKVDLPQSMNQTFSTTESRTVDLCGEVQTRAAAFAPSSLAAAVRARVQIVSSVLERHWWMDTAPSGVISAVVSRLCEYHFLWFL